MTDLTHGHLLNGRVRYAQPRYGFRSGIEPVLLAASVPARPGDHVLEGGSGAGAGLLCLAARVSGLCGVGVERDPELAAVARDNAAENGWPGLTFRTQDLLGTPVPDAFDHAFANPPYHGANSTASPDASRRNAKSADAGTLRAWIAALARPLRPRGTLTLVLPATTLPEVLAALAAADCGASAILPLWARRSRPAKLVLLRGNKARRPSFRLLPGLVLHEASGQFTVEAEAVLRGGAPLLL